MTTTKQISTPRRRRSRAVLGTTLAAGLAAATLAGCGNGLESSGGDPSGTATATASAPESTDPTPSPSEAASTSPSTSPEPSVGTSGSAGSSGGSGSSGDASDAGGGSSSRGACGTGQLSVGLRTPAGGGAAGSRYVLLRFTNTGSAACSLDGHPGVSFVGKGDGSQLGTSADRVGTPKRVRLSPGASTSALLKIADAGSYGSARCVPTTADGFRVYPPDSRASVLVRDRVQACQGELGRGSSQLQISPVGRTTQ